MNDIEIDDKLRLIDEKITALQIKRGEIFRQITAIDAEIQDLRRKKHEITVPTFKKHRVLEGDHNWECDIQSYVYVDWLNKKNGYVPIYHRQDGDGMTIPSFPVEYIGDEIE